MNRSLASMACGLAVLLCAVDPCEASPAAAVPATAEPLQFYALSFTDAPIAEAAEAIVGEALSRDLRIDPAVEGIVSFRADGWYGEDALLKDFGTALLDQDVALVRARDGGFALVPQANLPMMLARGGTLMALPETREVQAVAPALAPSVTGDSEVGPTPWLRDTAAALGLFFAGALSGALATVAALHFARRRPVQAAEPAVLRLTDQSRSPLVRVEADETDPDLVIPRFDRTA